MDLKNGRKNDSMVGNSSHNIYVFVFPKLMPGTTRCDSVGKKIREVSSHWRWSSIPMDGTRESGASMDASMTGMYYQVG